MQIQYTITDLPYEIIEIIYDQLDLATQMNFRLVSKNLSNFLLTNFWDFGKPFVITNKIIKRNSCIKRLDLSNSCGIYTVEDLINLRVLNIRNSRVYLLSNLPNLHTIFLDTDTKNVKLPVYDKIIVKTRPVYQHSMFYTQGRITRVIERLSEMISDCPITFASPIDDKIPYYQEISERDRDDKQIYNQLHCSPPSRKINISKYILQQTLNHIGKHTKYPPTDYSKKNRLQKTFKKSKGLQR